MIEKKSDRELREKKQAELNAKIEAFNKELAPLCEKHGVVFGARPVMLQDGRIGAQTVYYDAEEIKKAQEEAEKKDNEIIEE